MIKQHIEFYAKLCPDCHGRRVIERDGCNIPCRLCQTTGRILTNEVPADPNQVSVQRLLVDLQLDQ